MKLELNRHWNTTESELTGTRIEYEQNYNVTEREGINKANSWNWTE